MDARSRGVLPPYGNGASPKEQAGCSGASVGERFRVSVSGVARRRRGSRAEMAQTETTGEREEEMSGHATQYTLTPVGQKFVLHWGEMGTRWGINRTVAQVHALLFLAPKPLPADEISTTLAVARSNVSTSWREIDPTLRVLAECVQELKTSPQGDAYTRERLESMLEFLTAMAGLFEEILRMPTGALKGGWKLRGKVITLLGVEKKKAG